MFVVESEMPQKNIAPGVDIKVVSGDKAQMSFVTLAPGAEVPLHNHPHEQLGVVMEGEFELTIGDETRRMKKGDTYVIPGDVYHAVTRVYVPSVALDIFSPPREEYK